MTRVELRIAGSVERYDEGGRLLESLPLQQMTVSALSAAAVLDSLSSLAGQLATAAWPPVADNKETPDVG